MYSRIDDIYLITRRESKRRFRSRIYEMWGSECAYCGKPARSLDHVIPRHKGGLTVIENLIPACLSCNGQKRRWELDWLVSVTRILHDGPWGHDLVMDQSEPLMRRRLPDYEVHFAASSLL